MGVRHKLGCNNTHGQLNTAQLLPIEPLPASWTPLLQYKQHLPMYLRGRAPTCTQAGNASQKRVIMSSLTQQQQGHPHTHTHTHTPLETLARWGLRCQQPHRVRRPAPAGDCASFCGWPGRRGLQGGWGTPLGLAGPMTQTYPPTSGSGATKGSTWHKWLLLSGFLL